MLAEWRTPMPISMLAVAYAEKIDAKNLTDYITSQLETVGIDIKDMHWTVLRWGKRDERTIIWCADENKGKG